MSNYAFEGEVTNVNNKTVQYGREFSFVWRTPPESFPLSRF